MDMEEARGHAATVYCDKRLSAEVLDPVMCEVIAEKLIAVRKEGFEAGYRLGAEEAWDT